MKRMHIITQTKQKHSLIHSLVLARGEQEEKKGQQTWHSAGVGPSPWYPACTCTWMGQTPFSVSVALVCVCVCVCVTGREKRSEVEKRGKQRGG